MKSPHHWKKKMFKVFSNNSGQKRNANKYDKIVRR